MERKETGGRDICMYMHGDRVEECPGALVPNQCKRLAEEGQMEGKKVCHGCSIAHRHKHLTKDRVNPCLEIYHIHFLSWSI